MNRAERRAIARGDGRHEPMIETVDCDGLIEYAFSMVDGDYCGMIFENKDRLFISHQLCYIDIREEFMEDPYLLH